MDNTTRIKEQLDSLYSEYQKNKSQLNGAKTKEVAKHLAALSNSNNEMKYIAEQLSKFSADVVRSYFDAITKINGLPISLLDDVLIEFQKADSNPKSSQYFVQKYVSAITVIMKNSGEKALTSTQLAKMVTFIARYAVKSDKNKTKFQNLVNETSGGIYMLDYSKGNHNSLLNIWNVTKAIFPDLSKAKYESFIIEWATQYGFMKSSSSENESIDKTVKMDKTPDIHTEKGIHSEEKAENISNVTDSIKSDNRDTSPADNTTHTESGIKEPVKTQEETELTDVKEESVKLQNNDNSALDSVAKKLFISVSRNIKQEHDAISTQLNDLLLPISKSIEAINVEIKKSRDVAFENTSLKNRIAELEKQLAEQKAINQKTEQDLFTSNAELKETKLKIEILESNNAELDAKLADAYSINSRESSLEAEKIRSELKKSFSFLYEDWLDYEFSDATEDNYESLQAIIKKIFRSLERNGIDFKGNN